ncbi:MAG: hypothetical protein ACK4PK_12215 [Alphaproteobacteria bacterium]
MVGLFVALVFVFLLLWLVVQRRRHAAPSKNCTAQTPAPPAGDLQGVWHHKDLDRIGQDGIHILYRCRHCGLTLRHTDD